jgi:prepilin-type N-terminal cleavage/methylation domain-containing protein
MGVKARGIQGRSQTELVRAKTGFSLIELTVVLALAAILATLVMATSGVYSRFLVRAELDKLYSVCCYVKQVAQVTGRPEAVSFNLGQHSYSYENVQEKLAPPVVFGAELGAKGPPSSPRSPIARAVTFPNNQIIFHPTGIMQAGTVYISSRDSASQDLRNTHALSCAVSQVSFLRRYAYDGTWRLIK